MSTPSPAGGDGGRRRVASDPAANPSVAAGCGFAGRHNPRKLYPRPLTRDQQTTVIYGILCFVLVLVVLQLWLLIATMNAYLGGDEAVILPAAVASVVCLLLNLGLLRYLYAVERK